MAIGDWTERYQGTAALPRPVRDRLLDSARVVRFAAGKTVFSPDNIPDSLMFLVNGTIRVSQSSDSGRDIVLYRVEAGDQLRTDNRLHVGGRSVQRRRQG